MYSPFGRCPYSNELMVDYGFALDYLKGNEFLLDDLIHKEEVNSYYDEFNGGYYLSVKGLRQFHSKRRSVKNINSKVSISNQSNHLKEGGLDV